MKKLNNRSNAFTLIEMLVVLGMLAILMGVTFSGIGKAKTQAKIVKANAEVRELLKAWLAYEASFDDWPASIKGSDLVADETNLKELLGENNTGDVFLNINLDNGAFRDPWGTPYHFRALEAQSQLPSETFEAAVTFPNRNRELLFPQ